MVRSREVEDPAELEFRREIIRTHTPAQLSQINSIADFPVPKFVQKLTEPAE